MAPYLVPFILYLVLAQASSSVPRGFVMIYPVGIPVIGVATILLLRGRGILRPHRRVVPGILAGLAGIGIWIGLSAVELPAGFSGILPAWLHPTPRAGFDPFLELESTLATGLFLAVRGVGLVLITPVVEEVFWRGFLARWLLGTNWRVRPLGAFTPFSFLALCVLFMLVHAEWAAAFVYCALLNALLAWRRDLWECVVAHVTSNLVLFVYVITTRTWSLW